MHPIRARLSRACFLLLLAAAPAAAQGHGAKKDTTSTPGDVSTMCEIGCIPRYAVEATPDGQSATTQVGSSDSETFTVENVGSNSLSVSFSCGPLTDVTCTNVSPSSATLAPNASTNVVVSYTTSYTGPYTLQLYADGGFADDYGSYDLDVLDNHTAPIVDASPHNGGSIDVSRCVLDCLDGTLAYSTPAYYSLDTPRSATLVYRSGQAWPMPFVQVDATDTSSTPASTISIKLKRWDGAFQTLTNGTTEVTYDRASGGTNRIAAQFDASGMETGAYAYDVVVTSRWSNDWRITTVPVTVIVVNEKDSPFGWGWTLAGLQHAYFMTTANNGVDGVLITEGDGSAVFFEGTCSYTSDCGPSTFTAPAGEFSTVEYVHSDTMLYRRYRDGTTVALHAAGKVSWIGDRFGNQTYYVWDWANDRITAIQDPTYDANTNSDAEITFGYGSDGMVSTIDGPSRTSHVYVSSAKNVTGFMDPSGAYPLSSITYDSNHRVTSSTDRRGNDWSVAYDAMGRVKTITAPEVEVDNVATNLQHPITTIVAGERSILQNTTTSTRAARVPDDWHDDETDPRGVTTRYRLDRWRQPTLVIAAMGGPDQTMTVAWYNADGLLTTAIAPSGHTVTNSWNGPLLTQTSDQSTGRTTSYEYGVYDATSRTYGSAPEVDYFLNSLGLPDSSMVANDAAAVTKYTWDSHGRPVTQTDPGGHTTTTSYQTGGYENTASVSEPGGRTTTYYYDLAGRDTATAAPAGTGRVHYDVLNRVTHEYAPGGANTIYGYDDANGKLTVTDDLGNVHTTQYDALGRIDWGLDPNGQYTRYGYDLNGNVTTFINRNGESVTFAYDSLGNVKQRYQVEENETTTYYTAPDGMTVVASNSTSTDTLLFHESGRLTAAITHRGTKRHAVLYGYDSESRLDTVRLDPHSGADHVTTYAYGQFDQLTDLTPPFQGGAPTELGYNADRQASTFWFEGQAAASIGINMRYPSTHRNAELTFDSVAGGSRLWSDELNAKLGHLYSQDDAGRISERFDDLASATSSDSSWIYDYDGAGHLDHAWRYSFNCTSPLYWDDDDGYECANKNPSNLHTAVLYNPDDLGNVTTNSTIGTGNRLSSATGGWTYWYDGEGNLTHIKLNGVIQDSLVWNSLGQLVSVTRGSQTTTYAYDGFGQRVTKTSPSSTVTQYVYDRGNLIAEADGSGAVIRSYAYYPGGLDVVHSMRDVATSGTYYYVRELPNNVSALLDENGDLANRYTYLPYGETIVEQETVSNPLRFAGREWDADAELYYMRGRWYSPALKRFVSEDPIGIAGGMNVYAFAGGNPVNLTDPTGRVVDDPDDPCFMWVPDLDGQVTLEGVPGYPRYGCQKFIGPGPSGANEAPGPATPANSPTGPDFLPGSSVTVARQTPKRDKLACLGATLELTARIAFDAGLAYTYISGAGLLVRGAGMILWGTGIRTGLILIHPAVDMSAASIASGKLVAAMGGADMAAAAASQHPAVSMIPGRNSVDFVRKGGMAACRQ